MKLKKSLIKHKLDETIELSWMCIELDMKNFEESLNVLHCCHFVTQLATKVSMIFYMNRIPWFVFNIFPIVWFVFIPQIHASRTYPCLASDYKYRFLWLSCSDLIMLNLNCYVIKIYRHVFNISLYSVNILFSKRFQFLHA